MRTLEDPEYDEVWGVFQKRFLFRPGVKGPFPAIVEPAGSVTFEFAPEWNDGDIDEFSDSITGALNRPQAGIIGHAV